MITLEQIIDELDIAGTRARLAQAGISWTVERRTFSGGDALGDVQTNDLIVTVGDGSDEQAMQRFRLVEFPEDTVTAASWSVARLGDPDPTPNAMWRIVACPGVLEIKHAEDGPSVEGLAGLLAEIMGASRPAVYRCTRPDHGDGLHVAGGCVCETSHGNEHVCDLRIVAIWDDAGSRREHMDPS